MNDINDFLLKNENTDGVIMTSIETKNEETKRQLGFYVKKFEYIEAINECIQNNKLNLDLHERGISINEPRIKLFEQNNVQESRKQLLPLMEQFVKDFDPS